MKKILLALAGSVIITGSCLYLHRVHDASRGNDELRESETPEHESEEANGMFTMMNKMRNNQLTGDIPLADFYQARKDAKAFAAQGSRSALNLSWESRGPDNQGGRTRAILVDRNNPNVMYAGAVSGGLWHSINAGASWTKVLGSDNLSSEIISCIAQTANGNIYFGTGEYFGYFQGANVTGATGFPGGGVYKLDASGTITNIHNTGTTLTDANAWSFVNNMAVDGADQNKVWVCIKSSGTTKAVQILDAITDQFTNANITVTGVAQDVQCGTDGSVHVALSGKYYRQKAGETSFTHVTAPFDATGSTVDRLVIAIAPSDPNTLYFLGSYNTTSSSAPSALRGVWKTSDMGNTFTQIAGQSSATGSWIPVTQGYYALAAAVHPTNPDMLFIGGLDVYRYTTALGFEKISTWNFNFNSPEYVHADIHRFVFRPNTNAMYVGSDGGINYSSDVTVGSVVWARRNTGYITTQCYSACAKNYTGDLLTGMQDNGNWLIDFQGNTVRWGVLVKGGDGGDVAVSNIYPSILFGEYVNGEIARSSNNGASFSCMYDTHIDGHDASGAATQDCQPDDGAPFITQFELWENPNDTGQETHAKFFLGTNTHVWFTPEPLNLVTTPIWFRLNSSNLNGAVSSMRVSSDGHTVYAGTENGGLYRITGLNGQALHYTFTNGGTTQTFHPDSFGITTTLIHNFGTSRYVTDVDVDFNHPEHVVAVLGNYGNTDYVYESNDALGATPTFTSITGTGLPKMPVYSVLIDKWHSNRIVIGTEIGVYATANSGSSWSIENNGMPNVPVFKLYRHILNDSITGQPMDNVILAATYGRGMFRTESVETSAGIAGPSGNNDASAYLDLFPNPATNASTMRIQLATTTDLLINVYSLDGKLIKSVVEKNQSAGAHTYDLDLNGIANGTYLVSAKGNGVNRSGKLVVLK